MRILCIMVTLFLLLPFMVHADIFNSDDQSAKIVPYGYIDYELGQFVKGRHKNRDSWDSTFSHIWLQNVHGRLGFSYQPSDWLDIRTGFEVRMWFNTFPYEETIGETEPRSKYWSIYLHEAQGIIQLLDNESVKMDMAIGYFPYHYNQEVRNLGEYLFRTGTYPVNIINYYDLPYARLAGLRYTVGYSNDLLGLKFDLLGITETNMWPYHDLTLAGLLDFGILKNDDGKNAVINIGAGISLAHILPVDDSITTPSHRKDYSTYEVDTIDSYVDPNDTTQTIHILDRKFYSFQATKVMARATLDPLAFFRGSESFWIDIFGEYGGKIYGELAIVGFENYPINVFRDTVINGDTVKIGFADSLQGNPFGYTDIKERMPMMFGYNWPNHQFASYCLLPGAIGLAVKNIRNSRTPIEHVSWSLGGLAFGIGSWFLDRALKINTKLDIISFEFEYFNCPYPNDIERVHRERLPLPGTIKVRDSTYTDYSYDFYKNSSKNNWKWSLYMKKNISKNFALMLQLSRDHQRWEHNGHTMNWDFEDALVKEKQWAWNFKTEFYF